MLRKMKCDRCGWIFYTDIEDHTTCLQCMIRPSKRENISSFDPEEENRAGRKYKEKPCGCGEMFTPVGSRDVRCRKCKDKLKTEEGL
jgi:hypothetical protein